MKKKLHQVNNKIHNELAILTECAIILYAIEHVEYKYDMALMLPMRAVKDREAGAGSSNGDRQRCGKFDELERGIGHVSRY